MRPDRRYQAEHRQALQGLEGEHATAVLRELWEVVIGHQEDQAVRSELMCAWLYAFPQQGSPGPPSCLEAVAKECGESQALETMKSLQNISEERYNQKNPLEVYEKSLNRLYKIKDVDRPVPSASIGLPAPQMPSSALVMRKSAFGKDGSTSMMSVNVNNSAGGRRVTIASQPKPAAFAKPIDASVDPAPDTIATSSLNSSSSSNSTASGLGLRLSLGGPKGDGDKKKLGRKLSFTLKRSQVE